MDESAEMNHKKKYINIAEAARRAGVSPSTLRLWEKEGLIVPSRSEKGHRRYDADQVTRLDRIASLRAGRRLTTAGIRENLGESSPEAATPRDAIDAIPEMKEREQDKHEIARLKQTVVAQERKFSAIREILKVEESSPEAATPRDASDAVPE
ncbi:MerR family transcriptional regulator [Rhizobium leguminosarum]|uniref:MerR family transcriptional regulator n=1 Tax=Rhizobium leguminosarum TaxID=384 RepID=UPI001C91148F|nr:MerR family transcriptional regulator [Rhizobium leguminosarum]MBY5565009.1 MerR family transcriptional regulator [Rhizobium leguminosarum]MBY5625665.1 MerR family transcriptional regulator [Rhizobium leguminosarum]MBY5693983.1 MerR family transcriptional regulator [Rhizobium leguminosarum]MBY5728524.1 MerR family transcriptional regulator [Rhizobium leguminosarum]